MQDSVYLGDLGGLTARRSLIRLDLRGTGHSATPADPASYRGRGAGGPARRRPLPLDRRADRFTATVADFLGRADGPGGLAVSSP
jgi:hypothetical protein